MPVGHTLLAEHRLGVMRLSGIVDGGAFLRAIRGLYHDPTWQPHYSAAWDLREIAQLVLFPRDVARLTRFFASSGTHVSDEGRTAVLVRRELDDMIAWLLLRLREEHVRRETAVFAPGDASAREGLEAARRAALWLGVPPELLAPLSEGAADAELPTLAV